MVNDPKNREFEKQRKPEERVPPAGPHSDSKHQDGDKTPGTGVLPKDDEQGVEGPTG